MKEILQKESKKLRKKSHDVKKAEFRTESLGNVVKDMSEALDSQEDGVALAAPQIGINLRIFIVSWRMYAALDGHQIENISKEELENLKQEYKDGVFINPEIVNTSKDQTWMEEGCLSVRPMYGKVLRYNKCRVRAQDINGNFFETGGTGIMSQIFQHEIDHLNGTLFIDKARDVASVTNQTSDRV